MSILDRLYASGGPEVIIPTIEITCDAWDVAIQVCSGFDDILAITEDGRELVFTAAGIDVALPKRDNNGSQSLQFAISNVTGIAQDLIDKALDAEARMLLTFRQYISSDLNAPAERPLYLTVTSGQMQGPTLQVTAGFYDLINTKWPRDVYSTKFAPGLRYL